MEEEETERQEPPQVYVNEHIQKLWGQWIIFGSHLDSIQLRKQLYGLAAADAEEEKEIENRGKKPGEGFEFTSRMTVKSTPEAQDYFEAIVRGIMKRRELGLFQNAVTFYSELQILLDEMIKIFAFSERKNGIMATL